MKLNKLVVVVAGALLAVAGSAFAAKVVTQQHEIIVAKELVGTWKKNVEITRQLDPDRSVWDLDGLALEWDTQLGRQVPMTHASMRDRNVIASGSLTVDGKSYPCVLTEKRATMSLVWWLPSKDSAFGETRIGRINMVLARDHASDLFFFGGEDGVRGSMVCFSRSR